MADLTVHEGGGEGETIEGMAEGYESDAVLLEGASEQLSFDVEWDSSFAVNHSTLKMKTAPKYDVKGQYQPGDRITFTVTVLVDSVAFVPVRDRYKHQIGVERRHLGVVEYVKSNQPAPLFAVED